MGKRDLEKERRPTVFPCMIMIGILCFGIVQGFKIGVISMSVVCMWIYSENQFALFVDLDNMYPLHFKWWTFFVPVYLIA